MKIIYSLHAQGNIRERKIREQDIVDTLLNPEKIIMSKKNRKIAQKIINNKLLRVIFKEYNNNYIVITAYFTKPERYT